LQTFFALTAAAFGAARAIGGRSRRICREERPESTPHRMAPVLQ